jgi:hypothetical protein
MLSQGANGMKGVKTPFVISKRRISNIRVKPNTVVSTLILNEN